MQKCRETYARAVEALVELATLQVRDMNISCRHFTRSPASHGRGLTVSQTAFVMLDEVIKMVNRRGMSRRVMYSKVFALTQSIVNAMYHNYSVHPEYALYGSNLSHSEHVVIPRTENTIQCVYLSVILALSCL